MDDLTDVLNMVLAGVALAAAIWGFRQRSLLRRLQAGLVALRQGRREHRVRRAPEDREPVLEAFDSFAEQLQRGAETQNVSDERQDLSHVLNGICDTLRPPLVAIQSYASLLGQEPHFTEDPAQREYLKNLNLQVNGLIRLLASSADLSELRHGLSGLRRDIVRSMSTITGDTLLLLDSEGALSSFLAPIASRLGMKILVAPGEDAASIMARAIEPVAIIVNVARSDGLGWRALAAILRQNADEWPPVMLLAMAENETLGKLWISRHMFLLPPSDTRREWLNAYMGDAPWTGLGDEDIYHELATFAPVVHYRGTIERLPQGFLALQRDAVSGLGTSPLIDVIVMRRDDLQTGGTLADKFRELLARNPLSAEDLLDQVADGLSRLSDATSISKSENNTLAT